MSDLFSLRGETALVSGASRGIGRAIALAMAEAGATVIGTATTDAGAEGIAAALAERGGAGTGLRLDVTDAARVDQVLAQVKAEIGPVSVLVNNAGITRDNLFLRMKDAEWDDIIATNLSAVYRLTRACIRPMVKARHGRVINISSVVGSTGNPGQVNYAAAKAAVEGFGKSLARELGGRGITVNAIAPGFIESDMTAGLGAEVVERLAAQIALGRLGQAAEVAAAAVFLASPAGAYISGHTLHVNGGMHMA